MDQGRKETLTRTALSQQSHSGDLTEKKNGTISGATIRKVRTTAQRVGKEKGGENRDPNTGEKSGGDRPHFSPKDLPVGEGCPSRGDVTKERGRMGLSGVKIEFTTRAHPESKESIKSHISAID